MFENQRVANSISVWTVLPAGTGVFVFEAEMVVVRYPTPCVGRGMRDGRIWGQKNAGEKFCGRKLPNTMLY